MIVSNETACNDIQDAKRRRYLAIDFHTLQGDYDLDYSGFTKSQLVESETSLKNDQVDPAHWVMLLWFLEVIDQGQAKPRSALSTEILASVARVPQESKGYFYHWQRLHGPVDSNTIVNGPALVEG